jgi:restriction system protein
MIPDFQTLMLPVLKYIGDNQEHSKKEVVESLSNIMKLSEAEKREMLSSRNQPVFYNRITWVFAHFKAAKIITNEKRGYVQITELGIDILKKNPNTINLKLLKQLPTYVEAMNSWKNKSSVETTSKVEDSDTEVKTPEELIETGHQKIRQSLEQELLSKLKSVHPSFFEKIVVELLVKMGYGGSIAEAGKATRYTNDEGIDGIIKEDKLGLDVIYIQAKRWEGSVGRPEIQKFVGALAGQRAKKGVFITTSSFSKDAETYAKQMDVKIILIDGEDLAQYMIDYNLGVSIQSTYEIKKIDSDYFEEE